MTKHAGGRPKNWNKAKVDKLKKLFDEYIEQEFIPIIAEFAYKNNITRQSLYDYTEFSTLLKKAICKKEANLEKGCLTGKLNTAMAIFSLKQLGWKDKQEIDHTHKISKEDLQDIFKAWRGKK